MPHLRPGGDTGAGAPDRSHVGPPVRTTPPGPGGPCPPGRGDHRPLHRPPCPGTHPWERGVLPRREKVPFHRGCGTGSRWSTHPPLPEQHLRPGSGHRGAREVSTPGGASSPSRAWPARLRCPRRTVEDPVPGAFGPPRGTAEDPLRPRRATGDGPAPLTGPTLDGLAPGPGLPHGDPPLPRREGPDHPTTVAVGSRGLPGRAGREELRDPPPYPPSGPWSP